MIGKNTILVMATVLVFFTILTVYSVLPSPVSFSLLLLLFPFFLSVVSRDWVPVASGELRGPEDSGETKTVGVRLPPGRGYVFRVTYQHKQYLACRTITILFYDRAPIWVDDSILPKGGSVTAYFPALKFSESEEATIQVSTVAARLAPSVADYHVDMLEYQLPDGWHQFAFRESKIYPAIDVFTFGQHKFPAGGRVTVRFVSPFPVQVKAYLDIRYFDRTMYRGEGEARDGEIVFDIPRGLEGWVVLNPVITKGVVGFILVRVEAFEAPQQPPQPPAPPPKEKPPAPKPTEFPSPWDAIKELLRRILRDEEPVGIDPVVTKALIAVLFTILTYTVSNLGYYVQHYGLIPYVLLLGGWHGLLTHFWLHSGWEHFIGNALFLYVFGDNVEERFGYVKYLLFYLSAGIVAGLSYVAYQLSLGDLYTAAIGASGAIAGVMGAYAALFPKARVVFMGKEVPGIGFLSLWFLGQFALAFQHTNVAWIAHVAGFIYGALVGLYVRLHGPPP
jgi:membrane associated rhomboid family serine protease